MSSNALVLPWNTGMYVPCLLHLSHHCQEDVLPACVYILVFMIMNYIIMKDYNIKSQENLHK